MHCFCFPSITKLDKSKVFELLKAHRANDRAVMEAYGFYGKHMTKPQCVAELMKLYQKLWKKSKKFT